MSTKELTYKNDFDFGGFQIEPIVAEPLGQYTLFESELADMHANQAKLLCELERRFALLDGRSFGDQVHFQNAPQTPVQRWYPYREGYSVKLVQAFLHELNITSNTFDPFAGSGTTLLASRINNLPSFGIDINPISTLVSKAENEQYSQKDLDTFYKELTELKKLAPSENKVFETSFDLAEKIFNKDILHSLLQFKQYIKTIENEKLRYLFLVAWLSVIDSVSNIKKEGNGLKYKNRKRTPTGYIDIEKEVWETSNFPVNKFDFVKSKIIKQLELILHDLKFNYGSCEKKPEIFLGDCLEFDRFFSNEIEFTFFSPPYCNCFDYFEIHKVDLWLGDFINSKEDFRLLRNRGFRSNTNTLNNKSIVYKNEHLESLIRLFDSEKLWNKNIPRVVRGYFDDIHTLFHKIYQQTSRNGLVGIVIGNSAYSGVIIPTDMLIAEIAIEIGFDVRNFFVTRHLTTSSQQKKALAPLSNYLRESIVLLKK